MVTSRSKRRSRTWLRLSWDRKIKLTVLLKKTICAIVAIETRMPQMVVSARDFLAGLVYCHSFLFIKVFPRQSIERHSTARDTVPSV